jgi:hypothetical protein
MAKLSDFENMNEGTVQKVPHPEVSLMLELLKRGLTEGWTPEDIRTAETLTGVKCVWEDSAIN